MPNGRRGPDPAKDLAKFLLEKINESEEWELQKKFGASTAWEGEERLVVTHKDSDKRIYIWIDEGCTWGNAMQVANDLRDIKRKIEEIGLDL